MVRNIVVLGGSSHPQLTEYAPAVMRENVQHTDEAPGPSATTSAFRPQKSSLASSRSARRGLRLKRVCVERMSSSSSLVEVQVLHPLPCGRRSPCSLMQDVMLGASPERTALILLRRSERPSDGVGSSSRCSVLAYLTVLQTSHYHIGLPDGLGQAHHRRPAALPLLATVRHPLQQDRRPTRQDPRLTVEDWYIQLRVAPADTAPWPAGERRLGRQWHGDTAPSAESHEAGRAA